MNFKRILSTLVIIVIIVSSYLISRDTKSFLILLGTIIFAGIVVEHLIWKKARKKGAKDLIDILDDFLRKRPNNKVQNNDSN